MHNFPVYHVCNHILHKNIFHFPKKNNFMLVTPRTERYEGGATYLEKKTFMEVFSDCILYEYVIVM